MTAYDLRSSLDDHGNPSIEASTLRSRILRGLAWKGGSRLFLQLSRLIVTVILAHLLTPQAFGLAAMVLVLSGFIVVIGDSALGIALVQRRVLSTDDTSTIFWTGLGVGAICTGLGVASAGPIADFYGEPQVKPLFAALSLAFVITALGATHSALLVRAMDFRALELRQIGATAVGAVVGIAVALHGDGAWAIVLQQLAMGVASTALLWRFSPWRPRLRFSLSSLRSIGGFTTNVFGQNVLYQAGRNVDNVLVGRFLGASAVGAYALAYNVMLAPFHQIGGMVQQVMFPAFSRIQDDRERIAEMWIRAMRMIGALTVPALVGLMVVADDFVSVVLGDKWAAVGPLIQILAWVGLIQSLQTMNGDILWALGRTGTFFRFTVVWFVTNLVAFVVGVQIGLIAVAVCFAVSSSIVEPFNAWLTARALGVPLTKIFRGLAGIAQATGVMAAATLIARQLLLAADVPAAPRLGIVIVVGIAVYIPACMRFAPEIYEEIRRVRGNGPVAPAAVVGADATV